MQIQAFPNLNEMMRKAPLNPETVNQFRDQALQSIDHAIDTFFKPEREVAEGKQAYDKLVDVQRALRSYQSRFQSESQQVSSEFQKISHSLEKRDFDGDVGESPSLLPDGKPLKDGHRTVRTGEVRVNDRRDISDEQGRIAKVVAKMGEVLPSYGSVAMVPGPLSLSLKDHIKESLQWSIKGESQTNTNMQEEAYRLLTLSHSKKSVHAGSSSSSESSGKQETTTVDERVLPGLHEIRAAISQLGYAEPVTTGFNRYDSVRESDKVTYSTGIWAWKKEHTDWQTVNQGSLVASGSAVSIPGRLHMNAKVGNEGLTRPGAGADLVDMVANATLDQDFVDAFRERSLQVLDGATETLFNTQREVSEGRRRYDELSNLQRALTLASQRFGPNSPYVTDELATEIAKLNAVTPLYACVAMVPGEMSSSVKNHAKDLFEANLKAQSSGLTTTSSEYTSLFGHVSEARAISSESSSTTGYVRKESITTDERIMPILHDLRIQLDGLAMAKDRQGNTILTVTRPQAPEKPRY